MKLTALDLGQPALVTACVITAAVNTARENCFPAHMAGPTRQSECLFAAEVVGAPTGAKALIRESGCRIVGPCAALQLPVHIINTSVDRGLTLKCCRGEPK